MTKGDRIKHLREEKGLTQEELAKLLDTKRQTVSKYEKGIVTNIPSDKIEAMARILDTTPEYILGWDKAQIEKNSDTIVDATVRMRTDEEFLQLVESLLTLDSSKIKGVREMLKAFSE